MVRNRSRSQVPGGAPPSILAALMEQSQTSTELTPSEAEAKVADGAQLIDVRQQYEWDAGHIEGAELVPLEELPAKVELLDRDREVVLQCRSGSRSAFATAALREAGFDAFNLAGGLKAWVEEGLSIEPEDGSVADPLPDGR